MEKSASETADYIRGELIGLIGQSRRVGLETLVFILQVALLEAEMAAGNENRAPVDFKTIAVVRPNS